MIRENNEMIEAHDWSFKNMDSLTNDKICGCFYCCEIFKPSEIEEYIEECDGGRTAVCPHCGIDSVIGESSGFPVTKEFLTRMKRYWFDGGTGYSLKTPFGVIKLLFDGKEEFFDRQCVDPTEVIYPDVDGVYRIDYDFDADGNKHSLKLILEGISVEGYPESGERLEEISFYVGDGKITLGCYADFFNFNGEFDFDGGLLSNGIEVILLPSTASQTIEFGVCWMTHNCTENNETQTWYGADPKC
ncbi:MAG: hypothetical protein LIO49_07035 [Ruminococcus sp.]|nr:hypothetical protein [Ruminococcus sp.]